VEPPRIIQPGLYCTSVGLLRLFSHRVITLKSRVFFFWVSLLQSLSVAVAVVGVAVAVVGCSCCGCWVWLLRSLGVAVAVVGCSCCSRGCSCCSRGCSWCSRGCGWCGRGFVAVVGLWRLRLWVCGSRWFFGYRGRSLLLLLSWVGVAVIDCGCVGMIVVINRFIHWKCKCDNYLYSGFALFIHFVSFYLSSHSFLTVSCIGSLFSIMIQNWIFGISFNCVTYRFFG